MCDYVNVGGRESPIHIAAYLLWRLNWIHPFSGGNGRTSRAVSYYALCVRLGFVLPGNVTIPEQLTTNRAAYYFDCISCLIDRNPLAYNSSRRHHPARSL